MKHLQKVLGAVAAIFVAGCQAQDMEPVTTASSDSEIRFMREYGGSLPPIGYVDFCRRQSSECASRNSGQSRVTMTRKRWVEANQINTGINSTIAPATDDEIYRLAEYWTLPGKAGDCEDYVLAKRKTLIANGWPESALLITVVRDEQGLGHAVLTAATDMGDIVLDNRTDLIRPWADTNYVYYKRQSRNNPQRWVALMPNAQINTSIATVFAGQTN